MEKIRTPTQEDVQQWLDKHKVLYDENGYLKELPPGGLPVPDEEVVENIKVNSLRHDIPNLRQSLFAKRIMVFVAGGPSARNFLDEIKAKSLNPIYDVFCSNATAKWLLDHGITPKFQVILDPKPSKVDDVKHGADITYLIGLQCDPKVFDELKGKRVFKFLAASKANEREFALAACTADDPEVMSIGGGTMTGTRAMTLANAMGYRRLEYYGFDGSIKQVGDGVEMYAYNKVRGEAVTELELESGEKFLSTLSFQRQAVEVEIFRKKMPWLDLVIYGDGFLAKHLKQELDKEPKPAPYRISKEYLALQRDLHAKGKYGVSGAAHAPTVFLAAAQVVKKFGACTVLDYGCGQQFLKKALEDHFPAIEGMKVVGYDPVIVGLDSDPDPAELVVCNDVMEHIEPECIDAVLRHIESVCIRSAFFSIALTPASKTLSDGRNAHISLLPPEDWIGWIRKYFVITEASMRGNNLVVVTAKLPKIELREAA